MPTTLSLSLSSVLLLSGCSNPCGDWFAFIEDPRLERADDYSNSILIGREGTMYRVERYNPILVDSLTHEDLLSIESNANIVLVVGRKGTIRRSQDHGQTWSIPTAPAVTADLYEIREGCYDLISDRPTMLVGDGGTVLRTHDSGETWEEVSLGLDVALRTVAVLSENEALVAGQAGVIYRTETFGDSWSSTPSVTSDEIVVIQGLSTRCRTPKPIPDTEDYAFAASRTGDIVISDDRGRTWRVFDHFQHGAVTDMGASELLDVTILSGNSTWAKSKGEWIPNVRATDPITYYGSLIIIAGGIVYTQELHCDKL